MLSAYTDTCAQTCTSNPGILQDLQCPAAYLMPTTMASMVLPRSHLNLFGALLLHIESDSHQTHQVVYIAENIDGFYLSETAMKDLNIITQTFPSNQSASTSPKPVKAPCGCPLQAQPPEHPEQIPFPSGSSITM